MGKCVESDTEIGRLEKMLARAKASATGRRSEHYPFLEDDDIHSSDELSREIAEFGLGRGGSKPVDRA